MASKLKSRIPFMYLEKGTLKVSGSSLVFEDSNAQTDLPGDQLCCLLLGPGISVTHAAMKVASTQGVLISWVGEEGTSLYSAGKPFTEDCNRLLLQAKVFENPKSRLRVISWFYRRRFGTTLAAGLTEDQVRGMEGAQVKDIYKNLALKHKVPWNGRRTPDPVNDCISKANGLLTQTATVALQAAGFSPAIGFLHSGFAKAFSCDIADLYKFEVSVPIAFQLFSEGRTSYSEIRRVMRDEIKRLSLVDKMINDAKDAINAGYHST